METIETLFKKVIERKQFYENLLAETGENFNIFRILGLTTNEVRTHTAFLAELLNPKGSHGQKDLFLKCFLEQQRISDFDTSHAIVIKEFYICAINEDFTEGGSIDIVIKDQKNNKQIKIENKINAGDQYRQLLRYYNFKPEKELFYLTLNGRMPTSESTGDLKLNSHYKILSYKDDITNWLNDCIEKLENKKPFLEQAINQYINLIKHLTSNENKMNADIKKLVTSRTEYFDSIKDLSTAYANVINDISLSIWKKCKRDRETFHTKDGIEFQYKFDEDSDGFFLQILIFKGSENISKEESSKQYQRKLKDINENFILTGAGLGWINLEPFEGKKRIANLNTETICKLYNDENELDIFINGIINEQKSIINKFIEALEK